MQHLTAAQEKWQIPWTDSLVLENSLCYTFRVNAVFKASAFKHGYRESDFYEVLASRPIKRRSLRGVRDVYELFGQNLAREYLHILYRRSGEQITVFHMNRMTKRQKAYFRKHR